jgi:hypothetical protein
VETLALFGGVIVVFVAAVLVVLLRIAETLDRIERLTMRAAIIPNDFMPSQPYVHPLDPTTTQT